METFVLNGSKISQNIEIREKEVSNMHLIQATKLQWRYWATGLGMEKQRNVAL